MSVGKMTCWREILQIPRMWAIVQCFFLHKKQEGSSDKCYRNKLREGGSTYLAAGQKKVSYMALQALTSTISYILNSSPTNIEVEA